MRRGRVFFYLAAIVLLGLIAAFVVFQRMSQSGSADVANMPVEVRNNTYREIWYNMGRAFHYLDISYLALDCYCRALHSSVRAQGGSDERGTTQSTKKIT